MRVYRFSSSGSYVSWVDVPADFVAGLLSSDPNLTTVEPGPGQNKWNGEAWVTAVDLRGTAWHDPVVGQELVISEVGVEPPEGWVQGPAPAPKPSINDLKAAKNAAINAARLAANQSHFMFAGKQIAVDPLSRSDIDATHGAVLMLGSMPGGWPGGWKAKDNTIVPIPDIGTWGQFYGAMVAQGTANFAHAQALKAQLAAATTPEEVDAVPVW